MQHPINSASLDAMLDMLSNSHRRRILLAVLDHNPRDEAEFTPDDVSPNDKELEQLKTEFRHVHLPKLDDKD